MNAQIIAGIIKYNNFYSEKVFFELIKKNNLNFNIKAENFFKSQLDAKLSLNKKLNFLTNIKLKNFSLQDVNKVFDVNVIKGNLNLESSLKGNIKKKEKFYNTITGTTTITSKEIVINNLNLNSLKTDLKKLKNLESLDDVRKNLFNGNTYIRDQKVKLLHDKDIIKVPLTKIKISEDYIATSGEYNIIEKKINLTSNYQDSQSLLSLFSLNTIGNISNPMTKLSFNEIAVTKVLEKITKKRMKKVLEKKLEDKFDNIIENLLD